ncbi:MAG: zinc transporter ZntB [Rhodospirillaceae bacterium]|nr:zinc transporter ZntB [Rhodospirillaceae bacterium]
MDLRHTSATRRDGLSHKFRAAAGSAQNAAMDGPEVAGLESLAPYFDGRRIMNEAEDQPPEIRSLDGQGGGTLLPWDSCVVGHIPEGLFWLHLDWDTPLAHQLLVETFGVDPVVAEALVEEDTRPRSLASGRDELVILRGVNLTPGAEPEDMISLRMLVNDRRIITLTRRELRSISEIKAALDRGEGPAGPGEFVAKLVENLVDRIAPVLAQLEDAIDEEEDDLVEGKVSHVEATLVGVRARIVRLRRYLAPQREALLRLAAEKLPWIAAEEKARLVEIANQLTRYIEDLDAYRERAQVIQEEIGLHYNRRLTRSTFVITLAASVMVPLNLVAGLLGMNVGGIPGKDSPYAFWAISAVFALFAIGVYLWGRRRID